MQCDRGQNCYNAVVDGFRFVYVCIYVCVAIPVAVPTAEERNSTSVYPDTTAAI